MTVIGQNDDPKRLDVEYLSFLVVTSLVFIAEHISGDECVCVCVYITGPGTEITASR